MTRNMSFFVTNRVRFDMMILMRMPVRCWIYNFHLVFVLFSNSKDNLPPFVSLFIGADCGGIFFPDSGVVGRCLEFYEEKITNLEFFFFTFQSVLIMVLLNWEFLRHNYQEKHRYDRWLRLSTSLHPRDFYPGS